MNFTRLSTLAIACLVNTTAFAYQSGQPPKQLEIGFEFGEAEQEFSIDGYSGDLTGAVFSPSRRKRKDPNAGLPPGAVKGA